MANKDAILVTVETSRDGQGESSPMAAGFGYSSTPPKVLGRSVHAITPRFIGQTVDSTDEIAALAVDLEGISLRDGRGRDRPLGPSRAVSSRARRRAPGGDPRTSSISAFESGLAVGLYPRSSSCSRRLKLTRLKATAG